MSVSLCEEPYSKVYHKASDCRGLSNCSTEIYKVTLDEAVKMGRPAHYSCLIGRFGHPDRLAAEIDSRHGHEAIARGNR